MSIILIAFSKCAFQQRQNQEILGSIPGLFKIFIKNYISGHLTQDFFTLIDFSRYVDDCTVSDATDANKKVDIIENQCFASIINAINESTNMLSTSDFK